MKAIRVGLIGALTAALALAVAASASADTTGQISNVSADQSGHLSLALTASGLPVGAGLDASAVRVYVDGHLIRATARASETKTLATPDTTAMLVVDTSGSMRGSGIVDARAAAQQFLSAVPAGVRVGLEKFSDQVQLLVPPTVDRQAALSALPGLQPQGQTALYDALVAAADAAKGQGGSQRLVLISDGADTASNNTLSAALNRLRQDKVSVQAVGLRTARADSAVLRQIATATGGRFVLAGDGAALAAALRSSARSYATRITVTATVPTNLWGTDRHITVAADSSAGIVVAKTVATLGGVAVASAAKPSKPASKSLLWEGLLAIALALAVGAATLLNGDRGRRRATRKLVGQYTLTPAPEGKAEVSSITKTALDLADRVAQSKGLRDYLTLRLSRAGINLTPSEWLLAQAGTAFLTVLLFILFGMSPVVAIVVGVAVAPILGHLFLGFRFSKRRAAFVAALPDTLQLIAGSLSAGYSLAQSLDGIVDQGEQPIAGEFGRALAESRLGVPIEQTLESAAERMDSEDFRWVVLAIQIQHKVGGNLAEVLMTVAHTMRERVQLHRHVRALSAEGRLSAYLLGGLPVLFFLYLLVARGAYLRPLYSTRMGLMMLALGLVLFTIGAVMMKKMVKVEV